MVEHRFRIRKEELVLSCHTGDNSASVHEIETEVEEFQNVSLYREDTNLGLEEKQDRILGAMTGHPEFAIGSGERGQTCDNIKRSQCVNLQR